MELQAKKQGYSHDERTLNRVCNIGVSAGFLAGFPINGFTTSYQLLAFEPDYADM